MLSSHTAGKSHLIPPSLPTLQDKTRQEHTSNKTISQPSKHRPRRTRLLLQRRHPHGLRRLQIQRHGPLLQRPRNRLGTLGPEIHQDVESEVREGRVRGASGDEEEDKVVVEEGGCGGVSV